MFDKWSVVVIWIITSLIASVVAFVAVASGGIPLWKALVLLAGYCSQMAAGWRVNYLHDLLLQEFNKQAKPEDRVPLWANSWTVWEAQGRVRLALAHTGLPRRCRVAKAVFIGIGIINAVLFITLVPARPR